MIRPATTARVAALTECEYCGFAAAEGAALVPAILPDYREYALCTGCESDFADGRTLCDRPGVHGGLCDCADGTCA